MTGSSTPGAVGRGLLLVALGLLATADAPATQVLTRTETPDLLALGRADGIAISDLGWLFVAPPIRPLGRAVAPGGPVYVWAMETDRAGAVYLGTGPDGQILKIDPGGGRRVFHKVEEPMVTALAFLPDGDLLAAAAPGGRIHRISPDGRGEVWCETDKRYVWALAPDPAGHLFAGTGEGGAILRISDSGAPEPFFDSDEAHIVSLVLLPDGGLLAGGSGRGLVYRLDSEGHAFVVHDDDLEEAVAVVAEPDGGLAAAFIASPRPESRAPAVALRLPDGVTIGAVHETMAPLEESPGPLLRGIIEGLPGAEAAAEKPVRGRVVRVEPSGRVTELWSSDREAPFCLARDDAGRLLFGTGEPARLWAIDPGGEVSLVHSLAQGQLTRLRRAGGATLLATSNPAATYRVDEADATTGIFLSHPFDAGTQARWGSLRWRIEAGSGDWEFYTRTGNSSRPDSTWSAWSPALIEPDGSPIDNPDGRYLQYRLRLRGDRHDGPRISAVRVSYEPYNRAPSLDSLRLDEGAAPAVVFAWSASDPDGDPLEVRLEYRAKGSDRWETAQTGSEPASRAAGASRASGRISWDTSEVTEGAYELRATVSDQAANAPGEGGEARLDHPGSWIVDRTPPEIEFSRSGPTLAVRLSDRLSDIRRLEILEQGKPRFTARPRDGICDSRSESFEIEIPDGDGSAGWTLRGSDAAGNLVEQPLGGL